MNASALGRPGAGLTQHIWRRAGGAALAAVLLAVAVSACTKDEERHHLRGSGTLEAETAGVMADAPGRITRVAVAEGDEVVAGAVLVTLDTTLVDAQLAEAEAGLTAARAELERLSAGARPEELAVSQAALVLAVAQRDAAAAALDLARASADAPPAGAGSLGQAPVELGAGVGTVGLPGATSAQAAQGLAAAGAVGAAVAGQSVDGAETALRQAEAAVTAARVALDAVRQGASTEELAAAEAGVRQAEAAVAAVMARRARLTLRAPMAGRVLSLVAERGGLALAGAELVRVADLDPLTVTVYVPENQLHRVAMGDEVEVSVDAYPDDTFDGRVTSIGSEAEFTPRNAQTAAERAELVFAVRAAVPNEDGRLKPGMPADVEIRTSGAD